MSPATSLIGSPCEGRHTSGLRLPQGLDRLQREDDAFHGAVGVLHGVQLVELAAGREQVAGEGDQPAVDLGEQRAGAERVPLGRQDEEAGAAPGEGLVVLQDGVDGMFSPSVKKVLRSL